MKSFKVKIKGLSPYMQHRMDDKKLADWEKLRGPIIGGNDATKDDATRADYHCYRNDEGHCYIPSDQIRGSLIGAGTYMKSKVGVRTKSMRSIVAACLLPEPEQILLPNYDAIDKRSAVNRNIKSRVIVIRPKWSTWEAEFTLNVCEDSITNETVKQLLTYAGTYVGIGSYRPTCNGLFGRFALTSFTNKEI